MTEHLQFYLNKSVENEHNRVAFKKTTDSYIRNIYEKCTEECVSPTLDFSHKEKMCLTTCHSNFNRAINSHAKTLIEKILWLFWYSLIILCIKIIHFQLDFQIVNLNDYLQVKNIVLLYKFNFKLRL